MDNVELNTRTTTKKRNILTPTDAVDPAVAQIKALIDAIEYKGDVTYHIYRRRDGAKVGVAKSGETVIAVDANDRILTQMGGAYDAKINSWAEANEVRFQK